MQNKTKINNNAIKRAFVEDSCAAFSTCRAAVYISVDACKHQIVFNAAPCKQLTQHL